MSGPLEGIRIVEMPAVGPLPLACNTLAEMGATIIRIDRPAGPDRKNPGGMHQQNRPTLVLDLKQPGTSDVVLDLVRNADVLLEGYRPGVMERLGLGPDVCTAANPRLIYGRMTGWGQTGPLAKAPGHDLNYLALTGLLSAMGTKEEPVFPLNLMGDFAGGTMLCLTGVLAAIIEAQRSGKGQVLDIAMIDGINLIGSMVHEMQALGAWKPERRSNMLDSAAPFYRLYQCSDGKWLALGSTEIKFRKTIGDALGFEEFGTLASSDPANWEWMGARLASIFVTDTRDNWMVRLKDVETCLTPVLDLAEAPQHPHFAARDAFRPKLGGAVPNPAPRFSRTPAEPLESPALSDTLEKFGIDAGRAAQLAG
ncbi:MAG: CoA transferase [Novosphingobium sp.]|nr:CoA transferase [Novosphingobium sp.]